MRLTARSAQKHDKVARYIQCHGRTVVLFYHRQSEINASRDSGRGIDIPILYYPDRIRIDFDIWIFFLQIGSKVPSESLLACYGE